MRIGLNHSRLALTLALIAGVSVLLVSATNTYAQCQTFTTEADFSAGVFFNIDNDTLGGGQLHLSPVATPFPFVNVAASARGTMVRIDVNTGQILGEYLTAPNGRGRNPSRTTVDLMGNVWVANRDEMDGGKGSVVRIGLVIGGTRCDADGTPNPGGQYLKPPFMYSTVADRDGDGLIKTSYGLGNILPWLNPGGVDDNGGVSSAEDECIINYTRVAGTGARSVAVDANNDVWVGGLNNSAHEKLDGVTGQPVAGTQFNYGCGGYGALVDGNGVLWSALISGQLLRFDPAAGPPPGTGACIPIPNSTGYGLGVDNNGFIWHSTWSTNTVLKIAPNGTILNTYPLPGGGCYRGVAITPADNHVWIANSCGGNVVRLDNAGALQASILVGNTPTGVSVDANGKVWVANMGTNDAMRIDPATNMVDLTVSLGAGAAPYNYSDMTGIVVLSQTAPQGTWTYNYDGGDPGTNWGKICWNLDNCPQPPGTDITVRVRSSEDQVTWSAWVAVTNCEDFDIPDGQYLQVEVKLTPNDDGESPIICDLTICTGVTPIAIDIKPQSCPNPLGVKDWMLTIDPAAGSEAPVIPVAIPGTAELDVMMIDPSTIMLAGVAAVRFDYEDVTTPYMLEPEECGCITDGPDGFTDLTLKFPKHDVVVALDLDSAADGDCIPVMLTGELMDGSMIAGYDWMLLRVSKGGKGNTPTQAENRAPAAPVSGLENYPNPFNAQTVIRYTLGEAGDVDLAIYNALGQRVATLVSRFQAVGKHEVTWNGRDNNGHTVASGMYFSRLQLGNRTYVTKMTLLK